MKSGLQPWIGCGFHDGWRDLGDPSAFRSCGVLLVTIGASAGSDRITLTSGRSLASTRPTPLSVPPGPKPVTQYASRSPAKSSTISLAVLRERAAGTA